MDIFRKVWTKRALLFMQLVVLEVSLYGLDSNPFINKSVLIVEDSESTRTTLAMLFRLYGFTEVAVAENGDEALRLLDTKEYDFDIVFTDREMGPHMDGVELAKVLKSRRVSSQVYLHTGRPPEDEAVLKLFDQVFVKGTSLEVIKSELISGLLKTQQRFAKDLGGMICTQEFEVLGRDEYRFDPR